MIIAPKARRDYESILFYTAREWGEEQEIVYAAALDRALATLGDYPEIGRTRDDLRPGYRAYRVEKHVIIYRITSTAVVVLRILHTSEDAGRVLRGRS